MVHEQASHGACFPIQELGSDFFWKVRFQKSDHFWDILKKFFDI